MTEYSLVFQQILWKSLIIFMQFLPNLTRASDSGQKDEFKNPMKNELKTTRVWK